MLYPLFTAPHWLICLNLATTLYALLWWNWRTNGTSVADLVVKIYLVFGTSFTMFVGMQTGDTNVVPHAKDTPSAAFPYAECLDTASEGAATSSSYDSSPYEGADTANDEWSIDTSAPSPLSEIP